MGGKKGIYGNVDPFFIVIQSFFDRDCETLVRCLLKQS
jgi:hypothetical protein